MSLQIFSLTVRLFSVLSQSIGSLPQIQPSVPGFIPNFGPGAVGVDAFSVSDWAGENNWLVPPIYLISRTIFHLEVCGARGVLVVPKWPSAAFWPTVFPMGGLRPSVLQVVEFSDPSFARDGHNTIFCRFRFKSALIALLLDGSSLVS